MRKWRVLAGPVADRGRRPAPEDGARLIEQSWLDAWQSSNHPAILRPLIVAAIQWEEWTEEWDTRRETYRQQIIDAARQILQAPQPPDPG